MIFWASQWPSHHSFPKGLSTVFCVGSDIMDCGHETLYVAEVFIHDFMQECQAISGARVITGNLI